jgi:D-glycero-D-manno-heptose 1,7-bisphosphate phosphatase
MSNKALFLDRDGVINEDHGYVHKSENFDFIPGIFDLVKFANAQNFKVIVVTNQAGIGRGYYTELEFQSLTEWMCSQFEKQGGKIDAVYFSPFHPEYGLGKYKVDSECRKPAPGMFFKAQKDFDIDMSRSILLGDKLSDMSAGAAAGVANLFFLNGSSEGCTTIKQPDEVLNFLSSR